MDLRPPLAAAISDATGLTVTLDTLRPVSGGCINRCFIATTSPPHARYFVKTNHASRGEMFAAEAEGLVELRRAQALPIPAPITWGIAGEHAFLVLEYFDFDPTRAPNATAFGAQLARLHRTHHTQFGWHRDNTLGTTPQHNTWGPDWLAFWRQQRLGFQFTLARKQGAPTQFLRRGAVLLRELDVFFDDYAPQPALLHGDLWSGNYHALADGQVAIFDPAVYFGDRETDLAMTELFGGFPADFYSAYNATYPLHSGYAQRKTLYNLYHILNHFNLFGGAYLAQAQNMIESLLESKA